MTLSEILQDLHACEEDMLMYERKYGIRSATFYESYMQGDEPPSDTWVLDWSDWAGAYSIWLERQEQYQEVIQGLLQNTPLVKIIEQAARRELLSVAA